MYDTEEIRVDKKICELYEYAKRGKIKAVKY